MYKIHNITQPTNMLQRKFKKPVLVLVPVLFMALFIFLPAVLSPAVFFQTLLCISIAIVAYILLNATVYFKPQSSFDDTILLASPVYTFTSFVLPQRLNTGYEEVGADAFRPNEKCLPGLLLVHHQGAMKESLLEE